MSLLGERLRQAREVRGISPLQVEIDTRIRANVIQALEEGDYESLPPEPFLRGLIRSYANYLGIDPQEVLDLHIADSTPAPPPPAPPISSPNRPAPPPPLPQLPSTPEPSPSPAPPPVTPVDSRVTPTVLPPPSTDGPSVSAPPPLPPETLAPPEKLKPTELSAEPNAAPPFLAHITRRGLPFPVIVLVGLAVILSCIAGSLVIITQVAPAMLSLGSDRRTATPTRAPSTRTPTLQPGAPPTRIPTLAVTAAPFATFPGNATPTAQARRTPEPGNGLILDVDATETITIQVGIDGVMVFNGQMQPGSTNSWGAKDSLYVRVENPRGATLSLNGNTKWFGARTFAERSLIERQWTLNDQGTPVSSEPVAPSSPPAATPRANPIPSPTLTPFS